MLTALKSMVQDSAWRRGLPGGRARWLALMFVTLMLSACGSDVTILTVSNQADANEVMAALLRQGIKPSRTETKAGIVIAVPDSSMGRALDVLRQDGLPRDSYAGLGETFQKEGLISSPMEERALYIHALSQELAGTLSKIDGVVVARVHVVLPETAGVDRVATPAKAGVFIKYRASEPLDAMLPQLRTLVTHSIPGLTDENVSIALVPTLFDKPATGVAPVTTLGMELPNADAVNLEYLGAGVALAVVAFGAAGALWWRRRRAEGSRRKGIVSADMPAPASDH